MMESMIWWQGGAEKDKERLEARNPYSWKFSSTHQQFEDSTFLMEFGCYKVQQLHLVFTWQLSKTANFITKILEVYCQKMSFQ